jgi:hypothetical protein
MKKFFLIQCLFAVPHLFAQGGPALTKAETINYLSKKMGEITGHYRTILKTDNTGTVTYYYSSGSVSSRGDKVILNTRRSSYQNNPIKKNSL